MIILYRHGGKVRTGEYGGKGFSTSGFRKSLSKSTGNYVGGNPAETEHEDAPLRQKETTCWLPYVLLLSEPD